MNPTPHILSLFNPKLPKIVVSYFKFKVSLFEFDIYKWVGKITRREAWAQLASCIDHELCLQNCDLVHSLSILAGKILHWSYGKIDILCRNVHIEPRVMKGKAGQVLRCAPFHHIKSL